MKHPATPGQSPARSVRTNALAIAASQVLARAAGFVAIVVLTRALPIEDFGRYTLAFAFVALLAPLADMGTDLFVTREASQRREDTAGLLGASLTLKTLLGVLLVLVAGGLALALRYPPQTTLLIVLAAAMAVSGAFANSWFAVLRAAQRMDREAVGTVLMRVLNLAATVAAVALSAGVVVITGVQAGAAAVSLAAVALLARGAAPAPRFAAARSRWAAMVRGGLPFALTAIVVTIYFRIDTVMLSIMSGERATGIYGACANLLFASLLLSQALVTAAFPVVAAAGSLAEARARAVVRRALSLSLAAGLPLGLAASAFAAPALELLYGHGYREGGPVLVLLAWTAPLLFATNLYGHVLVATGRQREVLAISVVNAVLNIGLNLLLIPRFGAAGAALATLATELAGLAMYVVRLRGEFAWMLDRGGLARVLIANALFVLALLALRLAPWPLPATLAAAFATYLLLAVAAGVVRPGDLAGWRPGAGPGGAA